MHRLHRDPAPPAGLGHYRHGQHAWSNTCPTPDEREAIWDKLDAMLFHIKQLWIDPVP